MSLLSALKSDNPIVQRVLSGNAPHAIRLAAARGALPVDLEELVLLAYYLSADPESDVCEAVDTTCAELEDAQLAPLLSRDLPVPVIDFLARRSMAKPQTIEAVVRNPHTSATTLEHLARYGEPTALEVLVTNQVRLIESPDLIDAALENGNLSGDHRRRLLEVKEEFFTKRELDAKRRAEAEAPPPKELSAEELESFAEQELEAARAAVASGQITADAEAEPTEEEQADVRVQISQLPVPERIRLAMRGDRTARNELIRDSNRLVATSVIKSPKVTEAEVELIANMRNISDEVLRIVGTSREWIRNYKIVHILVQNPRTPLPVAMKLLRHLNQNDLKRLTNNRNVAENIRRSAKNMLKAH